MHGYNIRMNICHIWSSVLLLYKAPPAWSIITDRFPVSTYWEGGNWILVICAATTVVPDCCPGRCLFYSPWTPYQVSRIQTKHETSDSATHVLKQLPNSVSTIKASTFCEVWPCLWFWSYSPQYMGFSSLISLQSLSPSHRKARETQIFVVAHFMWVGGQVRGALKKKKQIYHKYISQTVPMLPDPGNRSNHRKAQLVWVVVTPSWLWSGRDDSYKSTIYLRQFFSSVVPLSKQLSTPLQTRLRGMHRPLPQVNSVVLLQLLNRHPTSSLLSPQSS